MNNEMTRKERIKNYIKEHKVEIGYVAVVVTAAVIGLVNLHKYYEDIADAAYGDRSDDKLTEEDWDKLMALAKQMDQIVEDRKSKNQ